MILLMELISFCILCEIQVEVYFLLQNYTFKNHLLKCYPFSQLNASHLCQKTVSYVLNTKIPILFYYLFLCQ